MRRRLRRALPPLALALLVAAPGAAGAAEPTTPALSAEIAPGEHTVGDPVAVDLTLTADPDRLTAAPRFPVWKDGWGDAELVAAEAAAPVPERPGTWRQRVVVRAFRTGDVALPPVEVALPTAAGTRRLATPATLSLHVTSVLPPAPEGGEAEIPPPAPPTPPRRLPWGAPFWWTAGVGAALLAAALALAWRRRRRDAAAARPPAPALPPLAELERALAAARAAPPAEGHARVSLALRRYLGRALRFPAAESTTAEIQRQLLGRHLPGGVARRAVDLLRACDLVKFARREAGAAALERWCAEAADLGGEIEAHLHPAPAPDAAEAAA